MRLFLRNSLLFLFSFLGLYCMGFILLYKTKQGNHSNLTLSSNYYGEKYGQHAAKVFQDFLQNKTAYDAIVIGSSHAYRGYDPRIFENSGYKIFNLGTSSQRIEDSYALAQIYLDSTRTQRLIFDIHEGSFDKGIEGTCKLMQTIPDFPTVLRLAKQADDPFLANLVLYRILTDFLLPIQSEGKELEQLQRENSTYITNGYVSKTDSFLKEMPPNSPDWFQLRKGSYEDLAAFLKLMKKRGIQVVLTTHPCPPSSRLPQHAQFVADIQKIASETATPYLDFSEAPDFDARYHYYDIQHLNQTGVNLYNDLLINQLNKIKFWKE